MGEAKPKVAWNRTPEEAEARIEYLKTQVEELQKQREGAATAFHIQIDQMQKQHRDALAERDEIHNVDRHHLNERYAALQQQLMVAQDLICKLQDRLLKVRQFVNEPFCATAVANSPAVTK